MNIFKLYYETEEKGFFGKLFGSKKKISQEGKDLAREYFHEMENISKALIDEINRIGHHPHFVFARYRRNRGDFSETIMQEYTQQTQNPCRNTAIMVKFGKI